MTEPFWWASPPLTNATANSTFVPFVSPSKDAPSLALYFPEAHGAAGDGVTNDQAALTSALSSAMASGGTLWLDPSKTYLTDSTVLGAASGILRIAGGGTIKAGPSLTGHIVQTRTSFVIQGMTIVGVALDGIVGFGASGSAYSFGRCVLENVAIHSTDYGVRFWNGVQFPLDLKMNNVYVYDFRTCGIMVSLIGGTYSGQVYTDNGQSLWSFDNIICTNGNAPSRSISAAGLVQTNDSPDTSHDTLTWAGGDSPDFGYVVVRLPSGSSNTDGWLWVADVSASSTTYTASKTAGSYYTYAVLRASRGVYLSYGKGISVGTIQTEYVHTGFQTYLTKALSVGSFYGEWRGNSLTAPTPLGNGFVPGGPCNVGSVWADSTLSAVYINNASQVSIDTATGQSCQRSVVHLSSAAAGYPLRIGVLGSAGSTPAKISNDGSAYSHNVYGANLYQTNDSTENQIGADHTTTAEFAAFMRGTRVAAIGQTSGSGYVQLANGLTWTEGAGSPEGIVTASPGSLYSNSSGGASTTLYVKESGTGNTGWIAK